MQVKQVEKLLSMLCQFLEKLSPIDIVSSCYKNCDFYREVKLYSAQLEYGMVEWGIIAAE